MLRLLTHASDTPDIEGWKFVRGGLVAGSDVRPVVVWADETTSLSLITEPGSTGAPTFVVRYGEIAQFTLSFASQQIEITLLDDDVPASTIHHLLVDQIWPRILAYGGELVLHAAGVLAPAGAILFIGQSGRGKSTLAASLHQRGLELLGDDALVMSVVGGEARCRAVYRSLRLFPDSIDTLFDQPVHRSEVAEYTDKENIHLPLSGQQAGDHRVAAIFIIDGDEAPGARIERMSPGDACMQLVEHSFWLDPTDMALTARKLNSASAIANSVATYALAYPRDYAKLGELHAAIFSVLDPSCE